ncbi:Gts1p [Saccharomyces cerevisiae x Saccharomyces kudriavzevii VIN7]|uniref:Gts1p n=1 Tax=Saccharomyces cerevisiae x Saccharomyces kudriavzevii (strain VIN7) TaxID=1095631 RepID=H0GUL1_SACCK|nr:Gts1p [Saccharomyces cerevisiae x Saccharomyces kudriavzevii VIN7]
MRFRSSSHSLKHVDRELKDLINSSENANKCGECGNFYPTWCSVNLGVFLCGRCASVHRKVFGSRDDDAFSNVKSLSMDKWTREDIDELVSLGGNKGNARLWNTKNVPFPFDGDDDKTVVEHYIRDKYILGKFRYDETKPEDFGSRADDSDRESDRFHERNRSRSRSASHSFYKGGHNRSDYGDSRDSFQSGGSRYSRQLIELRDMGYNDTAKIWTHYRLLTATLIDPSIILKEIQVQEIVYHHQHLHQSRPCLEDVQRPVGHSQLSLMVVM